jgi:hypothetical protein
MPDTTGLTERISQLIQDSKVHSNVAQDFIITTKDKLQICLTDHKDDVEMKREWLTPLGVLLSILLTLLTADFRDAFGISKTLWFAFFFLSALGFGVWFIIAFAKAVFSFIKSWYYNEPRGLDAVISDIMKANVIGNPEPSIPNTVDPRPLT